MQGGTLILVLAAVFAVINPHASQATSWEVEEHIRQVIKELPSDSWLRVALLQGARGNGVRFAWMDQMSQQRIKRVEVYVDIRFDRRARPKNLTAGRTLYFTQYDDSAPLSDGERLKAIRVIGLENELGQLALQQALHGSWVEHPRQRPIVARAKVVFFDDEWLPRVPLLYTTLSPPNTAN
jgi:hypothetical protein